jgi:hypothetical protein
MNLLHEDLHAVLGDVWIESPSAYRIRAIKREMSAGPILVGSTAERSTRRLETLAGDLYAQLYCRPTPAGHRGPVDELARRDHVIAVASANSGRGTWQAGWKVRQLEADGTIAVSKQEVTFWSEAAGVRSSGGRLASNTACSVWLPGELRSLVPGFYTALGDGDREIDHGAVGDARYWRLYWHLMPAGAAPFIRATTSILNAAGISFEVKVLTDPDGYLRADAGVLYLSPSEDPRVGPFVAEIHSAVAAWLRPSVPLFTKRIGTGLGFAEDPAGPFSFGQNRCRLVAAALWDAFDRGLVGCDDRAEYLAATFRSRGLDPLEPHREPGERDWRVVGLLAGFHAGRPQVSLVRGDPSTAEASNPDRTARPIYEAAIRIGDRVCRTAYWDRDGQLCNWMGRSMADEADGGGMPITPTAAALGPDLYSGSAGVALFLGELFAMTRCALHRHTALAAIERSILQLENLSVKGRAQALSFFVGDLGVAWTARRLALLTDDASLLSRANSVFDRVMAAPTRPHRLDLIGGNAGAIPVLLGLARDTGFVDFDNLAILLGEELCRTARRDGDACFWQPELASGAGFSALPLGGMSHGAAGMGLALFELYAATGRLDFRETARGAFAFEDALFDRGRGNWPDLREPLTTPHFARAWCHGAPGIAVTRLRAAALDPDRAPDYLEKAQIALKSTTDAIEVGLASAGSDTSLCHGLAGLGEIALIAGQVQKDPVRHAQARALADALIDQHGTKCDWPSGVPSRGLNPSLMIGLAGVGHWLLRLLTPDSVPSILLLDA